MRFLLDTHILLWWYLDDPNLTTPYSELLDAAEAGEHELALSVISLWEIAKLVEYDRITVSFSLDSWFDQMDSDPRLDVLPLSSSIILESTRLGHGFHRDPADQLIVATARCHNLRLITVDQRIRSSGLVLVV